MITHKAAILILIACCLQGPAGPLAARAGAQDQAAAPPYLCGSPSFAGQAEALMRILATPGLDMEQSSIVILNGDSPDPVFAYHADLPLLPASVMKVFTSAAALHYLKPEYVFTTVLAADGAPAQGVIQGNVYLQASADPYFTPEQMHAFAARVAHEGIRALRGTLIVDTAIQETEPFPSTWEADDIGQTYAPPIFPLSYAFNAFSVRINGSNAAGGKPDIWIMPDLPLFHVVNNAAVATQGRTELSIQVIDPAPDGRIEVMVDGRIRAGETFQDYRTVQRPAEYFLAAFFDELRKQGVETDLDVRAGQMPAQANILVAQESLPLGVLVRFMNLLSNNFMAELLLRQVGGYAFCPPGSTEKGARAVQQFLQETGIPAAGLQQWDGSGLSRCDRSTAMAIARLCLAMRARYDIGPDFMASLSTNGGEGTLAKQLTEPEYYRRFRAKNGALRGVYTAGGYLAALSGKQLIVVFMLNNAALPFGQLQEIGNEIVRTVVNY